MKDFDSDRERRARADRRFKIGGHEFRFKAAVQQELVDAYWDDADRTNAEWLTTMDALVLAALEPDCHDAWRAARSAEAEYPLMWPDIRDVIQHMLEVMLNRPTEKPSGSGSTPENDVESSTAKSPLREVAS